MNLWLAIGSFLCLALYILSIRVIGRRLAIGSWNVWNEKKTGPWAYFLFPASSQLGWIGNRCRYVHSFNPSIVEIAGSAAIELRGGTWAVEGRAAYIAITAIIWPLKLVSSAIGCPIVLLMTGIVIVCKRMIACTRQLIYCWTVAD